ncbi:winged helix-turn-helix transcriptional regulator [Streptomonospora nanhaiensis]|uniref:DNA-binding HxlR family transcriptional regulator n=1 Tax=Streptomonospora nanhaiensis TaxID=1323731 RepID=A0A853BHU5_9ACTN|nr:helix-turn-helix domain-containing protein [Streptomonospora nanhaiensis]MBV2366457.1 helix-turn-helix transcriptional regulator [Streptomonospora nanhaiensis]MBX9389262.1 helix-turn-helix transcriptional regulator [Streptomonospora nanhaiensis]NYI94172.1 DNA-binding HxlR family transcriptional regulator [Streptomonospora nanhaiensis]
MQETADTTAQRGTITPKHRELLDQVLDKWSLQVLDQLCERPLRFNELRRAIPVVTQKSLTATLRRLERNGMVERVIVSTRPLAVEYRIAPLGRTLQDLIDALLDWSAANMPAVERARERFDTEEV